MRKRSVVPTFILAIATFPVLAQLFPMGGQYLHDDYLLNPAATGSKLFNPIRMTYQKLYPGIQDNPVIQSATYHGLISGPPNHKTMGIGAGIQYHGYGPASRTQFQLTYAYHADVKRKKNKLAFGLSLCGISEAVKKNKLVVSDPSDPLLAGLPASEMYFNASAGIYFYSDRYGSQRYKSDTYHAGLVVANLPGTNDTPVSTSLNSQDRLTHLYLHGAYGHRLTREWMVEPTLLIRSAGGSLQMDITARMYYHYLDNGNVWAGLSFRSNDAFSPVLGMTHQNISLGYALDLPMSDIKAHAGPSHLIHLGILLNRRLIKTL